MPETCKAYYKCVAKNIKEILLFANEITSGILISIDRDVKELSLYKWYEILSTITILANLIDTFSQRMVPRLQTRLSEWPTLKTNYY